MKAKVPKCFCLAIAASSGKRYDPKLQLSRQDIPFIGNNNTIKFLGGPIRVPQSNRHHRIYLLEKLEQLLQRVDEVPVSRKQKLLLYKAGICPRLNWDLGVMELPISWVESTLEAKATQSLKRWVGLAKCAETSRLYLPRAQGGLQLPPLTLLYKKLRASQASLLLTSKDRVVQHVVSRLTQHEENQHRTTFRPMVFARDLMAENPGVNRQGLVLQSKSLLMTEDADRRVEHAKSLPCQGQFARGTYDSAAEIWSVAVSSVSSGTLKFIMNAATDTLPHNSNLVLWGRSSVSRNCKLCRQQQTLMHVLNHCPVALELRRYNHRHDAVLSVIANLVKVHLSPQQNLITDLPGEDYHYPPHIGSTDSRPDIVVWQDNLKIVVLMELTVCFETNFIQAQDRKKHRYTELIEEAKHRGYKASLMTIEVGSRGMLDVARLQKLKSFLKVKRKKWEDFLVKLSRTAIEQSHKIWSIRNWRGES